MPPALIFIKIEDFVELLHIIQYHKKEEGDTWTQKNM